MRPFPRFTRRRFLSLAGVAAVGTLGYTWYVEPHWLQIVERDMPVRNLPAEWEGRTLVQISDLHVGNVVDIDFLTAALQRVSRLAPDLIGITGDFMTCTDAEQVDAAARLIQTLRPGRLGVFAVLGNHDYGRNWARPDVAERLVGRLTDLGVRTLRNEATTIGGLQFVGIDDFWATNFRPEAVVPEVNWNEPTVTLCHNPDAVDRPIMAQCRGWILSGHTHGGQCKPPFLPPPMLPVVNKRYTAGEFDVGHSRRLYINRGLGYLKRMRFNARPEVTVFRMRRETT